MDPALTIALIASATGAVSAFVGYWWGFGNAERDARRQINRQQAIISEQQLTSVDLANQLYEIRRNIRPAHYTTDPWKPTLGLSIAEREQFDSLVTRFREDV